MPQTIKILSFYLDKGIEYTECIDSGRCPGGIVYGSTVKAGPVDLVIQLDTANAPVVATAYQPNIGTCSRATAESSSCELRLQFEGEQLTGLINGSSIIQKRLQEVQNSKSEKSKPPAQPRIEVNGPSISDGVSPSVSTPLVDPALMLGLVGGAAFTAIQYLVTKAWSLRRKMPSENKKSSKLKQEAWQNSTPSQADCIAKEIERQLFGTKQKVGILIKEVEELKTDLIDLSQKGNMPSIKAPSVVSRGSDISFSMQEPREYPPVLPTPLSIELIKQAVASWNYQAIGSYDLDFVTETSESREGLTETKTFTIDGNQSQSASRSQSEFIAISCQNTTYLIPNILQNAADPARIIKIHLERIYKRGVGADLKNLTQLATVRKSGNCYELVEMGQVS